MIAKPLILAINTQDAEVTPLWAVLFFELQVPDKNCARKALNKLLLETFPGHFLSSRLSQSISNTAHL